MLSKYTYSSALFKKSFPHTATGSSCLLNSSVKNKSSRKAGLYFLIKIRNDFNIPNYGRPESLRMQRIGIDFSTRFAWS